MIPVVIPVVLSTVAEVAKTFVLLPAEWFLSSESLGDFRYHLPRSTRLAERPGKADWGLSV